MSELEMSDWRMRTCLYEERTGKKAYSTVRAYSFFTQAISVLVATPLAGYLGAKGFEVVTRDPNYIFLEYVTGAVAGIISTSIVTRIGKRVGERLGWSKIKKILAEEDV